MTYKQRLRACTSYCRGAQLGGCKGRQAAKEAAEGCTGSAKNADLCKPVRLLAMKEKHIRSKCLRLGEVFTACFVARWLP